jgi:hypothetical protein
MTADNPHPPPTEQDKARALMQFQRAMKHRRGISLQHARGNPIRTHTPKDIATT